MTSAATPSSFTEPRVATVAASVIARMSVAPGSGASRCSAWLLLLAGAASLAGCDRIGSPHTRGTRFLTRGEYSRAVEAFTEAIEKDDHTVVAYANRCYAWEALGEHTVAVNDCSQTRSGTHMPRTRPPNVRSRCCE